MSQTINPGSLSRIIAAFSEALHERPKYLEAILYEKIPELKEREICFNCGASMWQYLFKIDGNDAALLLAMAQKVREQEVTHNFTEANSVYVTKMKLPHHVLCRTTQCRMLGLIAKVKVDKKQVPGHWLITGRGWSFLRGEPVPKDVVSWRNSVSKNGRPVELTTIREVVHDFDSTPWQRYGIHEPV